MDNQEISERIRNIRRRLGLSQEDVAFRLDVTQATYSSYENGKVILKIDTLYKLADILQVSPMYLLTGEDGEPDDDDSGNIVSQEDHIQKVSDKETSYIRLKSSELSNKQLKVFLDIKNEIIQELQNQLLEIKNLLEKSLEKIDKKDDIILMLVEKMNKN